MQQEHKFKKDDLCFYIQHGQIIAIIEIIESFPKYHKHQTGYSENYVTYTYNVLCDVTIGTPHLTKTKKEHFGLYYYVCEHDLEKFSLLKLLQHRLEIDNTIKLICNRYNASE